MLYRDLVKLAVDYARRRTDWQLVDVKLESRWMKPGFFYRYIMV